MAVQALGWGTLEGSWWSREVGVLEGVVADLQEGWGSFSAENSEVVYGGVE